MVILWNKTIKSTGFKFPVYSDTEYCHQSTFFQNPICVSIRLCCVPLESSSSIPMLFFSYYRLYNNRNRNVGPLQLFKNIVVSYEHFLFSKNITFYYIGNWVKFKKNQENEILGWLCLFLGSTYEEEWHVVMTFCLFVCLSARQLQTLSWKINHT